LSIADQAWAGELRQRKSAHLLRVRNRIDAVDKTRITLNGRQLVNFSSNNYLGLARHPNLKRAFIKTAEIYGMGAGASQLVSGYSRPARQLEDEIAEFTGRQRSILFSSGYLANLSAVSSLLDHKGSVYLDRLCHASLIDAALLSRAKFKRYRHASAESLNQCLSKDFHSTKLVLTDTIFSMDGDFAPVPEMAEICGHHRALLVADDAHGIGVMGETGAGSLEYLKLSQDDVPVLVGTFSKAFGLSGAFIAGSDDLVEMVIQKGRSAIYSTALMPAVAAAASEALNLIKTESWRREKLFDLIQFFKSESVKAELNVPDSSTPVQTLIIGASQAAVEAGRQLLAAGFYIPAIRPPTVPAGTARLRITLTAEHTKNDIKALLQSLSRLSLP